MAEHQQATPLSAHTFESLCDELLSGRRIALGVTDYVQIESAPSRNMLDWYLKNGSIWRQSDGPRARQVRDEHIEALLSMLDRPEPPAKPPIEAVHAQGRRLHIKSVRASQFGGLTEYSASPDADSIFEFSFEKAVTLLQGKNGAGKTTVLNAIAWCLTGLVYRTSRPSATGMERVELTPLLQAPAGERVEVVSVATIPTLTDAAAEKWTFTPRTWVALTLVDPATNQEFVVSRRIVRVKGTLKEEPSGLDALGLPPLAREAGAKLPAAIPYVRLDERSDPGTMVAALTGIKPLAELAAHARSSREKLLRVFPTRCDEEIAKIDSEYRTNVIDLTKLVAEHPTLRSMGEVPASLADDIRPQLESLSRGIQQLQEQAFARAAELLGESFNPRSAEHRRSLREHVDRAVAGLRRDAIERLPTYGLRTTVSEFPMSELAQIEHALSEARDQYETLSERDAQPHQAARVRLYALVASWLRAQGETEAIPDLTTCPVCSSTIDGLDAATLRPVKEHLDECLRDNKKALSQSLEEWAKQQASQIRALVPDAYHVWRKGKSQARPSDVIRNLFAAELASAAGLQGMLSRLRDSLVARLDARLVGISDAAIELPEWGRGLPRVLNDAILTASEFVSLRRRVDSWSGIIDEVIEIVISGTTGTANPGDRGGPEGRAPTQSIQDVLIDLRQIAEAALPLELASTTVNRMIGCLTRRMAQVARIAQCKAAADALQPLCRLDTVVARLVQQVTENLASKAMSWKSVLYEHPHTLTPKTSRIGVSESGAVSVDVDRSGVRVPAQHISNASDLRSTLLALVISLVEYLSEQQGGIVAILLDDPHELFDPDNRERLARCMGLLGKKGIQVIATTNDDRFAREMVVAVGKGQLLKSDLDARHVLAPNGARRVLHLAPFVEVVEEWQHRLESPDARDDHGVAQGYVAALRAHLEELLKDFLEGCALPANQRLMIGKLLEQLELRHGQEIPPYDHPLFGKLRTYQVSPAGAEVLRILNQAHHDELKLISFGQVWRLRAELREALTLFRSCAEVRRSWARRDTIKGGEDRPEAPLPVNFEAANTLPMCSSLAAFVEGGNIPDSDAAPYAFDLRARLVGTTTFRLYRDTLGAAAPRGSYLLVRTAEEDVQSDRLVVALIGKRVLARRLIRPADRPDIVVLANEAEDPRTRIYIPAESFKAVDVRLLKVAGVFFDSPKVGRGDAPRREMEAAEHIAPAIGRLKVAFKVDGHSALPLALDRQTVFGGREIQPEELEGMKGRVVALSTDGGPFLKRVGAAVPGAAGVRVFEKIGGHGDSGIFRVEGSVDEAGFAARLPRIMQIREVLGVLYDQS